MTRTSFPRQSLVLSALVIALPALPAATETPTPSVELATVVQSAVNGAYDAAGGTLILRQVNSVAPGPQRRWHPVRSQAFVQRFAEIFPGGEGGVLATLVVEDAGGDARRSHHLVRVAAPRYTQASNTATYSVELLSSGAPPPAGLARAFLVFSPGSATGVTDPEPLDEIDELSAGEIREAFSAQTANGGDYDAAANRLTLRGVSHFLVADAPFTQTMATSAAEIAPEMEEGYRSVATKPIAVLGVAGERPAQWIVRLEDVAQTADGDGLQYSITSLAGSEPLPVELGPMTLVIPPVVSFGGRGWPSHSVCCDCDLKCASLWVLIAYCKTCVSPLGASKCCKYCKRPPTTGGKCP